MRKKVALFIVILNTLINSSILFTKDSSLVLPVQEVKAQSTDEVPTECIGQELLKYLAAIEEGTRGLNNIRLLSPAFNMTSPYEYDIYQVMKTSPAPGGGAGIEVFKRIWGFAGNTYSLDGVSAYDWVTVKTNWIGETAGATGKKIIFTEFGDFDTFGDGKGMGLPSGARGAIIGNMTYEFKRTAADSNVAGINYFNALGGNPGFVGHKLDNGEIKQITSSDSKKGGINSALYISGGGFQEQVAAVGANLGWTTEIIRGPTDLQASVDSVTKGYANGMQTVLRACVGDSCGFSDPNVYVKFLRDLNAKITQPVYVIAGPNEPATEHWAAPRCKVTKKFDLKEVPCRSTIDPEFHSLRPYPTNPCRKDPPVVRMCGNDLVVSQTISLTPGQGDCVPSGDPGGQTCTYNITSENSLSFGLSTSDFPIMGNTELVKNAVSSTENIDFRQRMNEYVSWYLNGVPQRAEEPNQKSPVNDNNIINLSGPLKKLLPQFIQQYERNKEKGNIGNDRHNQIVSCGNKEDPQACYSETSSPVNRLPNINTKSNSHPYIPYSSTEDLPGTFYAGTKTTSEGVTDVSVNLSKDTSTLYFAHMEEDPQLADLLQRTFVSGSFVSNGNQGFNSRFKVDSGNAPDGKIQELNDTPYCEILDTRTNPGDKLYGELVRPGAPATEPIKGNLNFKAKLVCEFGPPGIDQAVYDACIARPEKPTAAVCKAEATMPVPDCLKEVNVGLGVQVDTPNAYAAWDKLVAGDYSIFKRIFPKVGPNSVIDEIKNVSGESYANYTSSGTITGGTLVGSKTLAGNPFSQRSGSTAKLFFPYVGSIYDYFLKGIQIALRPKGMGNVGSTTGTDNGNSCGPTCGPFTPGGGGAQGNGTCDVGGGYCSIEYLLPFFSNDPIKAEKASRICNRESASNPAAANYGCVKGRSVDYSIGLFQINLLAHCPASKPSFTWNPPSCTFGNIPARDLCENRFLNQDENIKYAVQLSKNGTDWSPWSAARACGIN